MIAVEEVMALIEDAKNQIMRQGWKVALGALSFMLTASFVIGSKITSTDRDIADIKSKLPTPQERQAEIQDKIKLAEDIATIKTILQELKEKLNK